MGYLHQTNAIYVLIKEREFFKLQTSVYFDLIYESFPLSCFNFGKEMISNEFHRNWNIWYCMNWTLWVFTSVLFNIINIIGNQCFQESCLLSLISFSCFSWEDLVPSLFALPVDHLGPQLATVVFVLRWRSTLTWAHLELLYMFQPLKITQDNLSPRLWNPAVGWETRWRGSRSYRSVILLYCTFPDGRKLLFSAGWVTFQ